MSAEGPHVIAFPREGLDAVPGEKLPEPLRKAYGALKFHLARLPDDAPSLVLPAVLEHWRTIRAADAATYVSLLQVVRRDNRIVSDLIEEFCRKGQPHLADGKEAPRDLLAHSFWVRDAALNQNLPYVVKAIFGKGQLVVLWGAPGSGKSFIVLEMSCAVGAGLAWRGRRTKRGVVLYVVAESARAYIENRLVALKREWPAAAEADVLLVPLALDILNEHVGDVDRVIATANLLAKGEGEVALIVIDTLAVTMRGGSENEPRDMSQYIDNIKRIIAETGAAVLVVHHCGKDEARGMRGHSALLGALDAELAIEGAVDKERILRTGKVRDGHGFTDLFAFTLRPVDLGIDPDGDPVRSCVVDGLDPSGTKRVRRERKGSGVGKHQRAVLLTLEAAGGRMPRIDLAHKLKNEGMPKNRVYDALASLIESGMLVPHNDVDPPEVSLQ